MTGPLTALNLAFVHAFNFKGRATRAEFWWVILFFSIIGAAASFADGLMLMGVLEDVDPNAILALGPFDFFSFYFFLITLVPHTSLAVRRLHDAGFSGFCVLFYSVPLIGQLVLLVMFCLPSSRDTSVHGSPKGPAVAPGGKPVTVDVHKRAMQGYATLFDSDKPVTQEMQAARKAEISDYYRSKVLKSAPAA